MIFQLRADKLRESCSLLRDERLDAEQFLDRVLYINKPDEFVLEENVQDVLHDESSTSMNFSIETASDSTPAPKGICISCKTRHCDIILLPCFDIVVCSVCWEDLKQKHYTQCEIKHKKNHRKKEIEKKKTVCPCCGKIVKQSKEFHMATLQS